MQTKKVIVLGVLGGILCAGDIVQAGTYAQYKACLINCYSTTPPWSIRRQQCVDACAIAYLASQAAGGESFNVTVNSPAVSEVCFGQQHLRLVGDPSQPITFSVIVTSGTPTSVQAFLTHDELQGGGDPELAHAFATDTNGADGWNFTMTPDDFSFQGQDGSFSGQVLVRANIPGHNLDDGDARAIMVYASPFDAPTPNNCPTVSTWGLVAMSVVLLIAASCVIRWRKVKEDSVFAVA